MTREQKIVKAERLREEGLTFREIGEQLGVAQRTAYRWLNPDVAAADRKAAREYKARNREAMRAYDKRYDETHKGVCPKCGDEMDRRTARIGGECRTCIDREVDQRARQIERWWVEGLSLEKIADALGWSISHLSVEIHRLREKGYRLPYRYRLGRPRFPDQARA